MTLAEDLHAQAERSAAAASPETRAQRLAAVAAVAASGIDRTAVAVGDLAPAFTLPDATGRAVALSSLLEHGPVVLSFYRGGWCPYCTLELRALQAAMPRLSAAGGTLVAISPEAPDSSLSTAEKAGLEFAVLSDTEGSTITAYGLRFTVDAVTREVLTEAEAKAARARGTTTEILPVPATYVVGTDGVVRYAFVDTDHRRRAEPDDLVAAVASLTAQAPSA
ncbi:peroxiredoxin-like family protein [Actinotalea sp.]|uniref:peroxiredoxin-like family protein n=1 Tax=Actinotalea sp. TaxID=1872145 RepID=UPI003565873C